MNVEIFWNGKAYDFDGNRAHPSTELHDVWLQAHEQGLRVTGVARTPATHATRQPPKTTKTNAELEADFEGYMAKVQPKTETEIKVKP